MRIASLAQWGEIQTALAGVGNVTSVNVTAMDIGYARVNLTYQGGLDQLREAFARRRPGAEPIAAGNGRSPEAAMIRHLPNLLSALRLLAAPFAAWLILNDHDTAALAGVRRRPGSAMGWTASSRGAWHVTSRFGAWLDPAADKLLMLLCFIALFAVGATPLWLVALVVARDRRHRGRLAVDQGCWACRIATRAPVYGQGVDRGADPLYSAPCCCCWPSIWDAPRLALAGGLGLRRFSPSCRPLAYAGLFLRGVFAGRPFDARDPACPAA